MVEYSPFSEEVMRGDPYPIYTRLRDEAPAYFIERYQAWAISRFEDIWQSSMDNEHFSCEQGTTASHLLTKVQPVTPMINMMDPPAHTKLRSQIRTHFAPRVLGNLEPMIRKFAGELIESARDKGELDVMGEFASQIAVRVACTVNGIPVEDGDLLSGLVTRFFGREPGVDGMTPDGLAAMGELAGYFVGLARSRRGNCDPAENVVNLLTAIEFDGQKLDDESIASHLTMLIIGGAETFPKVFANGIRRLGEHPEQRARLAADPSLIPDAFQEILRYDMPTQFLCREVTKDFELHGRKFETGQPVLFLYPSANRDPREFENPDVFDIRRCPPRILSFGHGTHACLGIHVAKLEGKLCIEETLKRIPNYEIHLDRAERLVTDFVHGYASFPITFETS
jgi:cytochrome P450